MISAYPVHLAQNIWSPTHAQPLSTTAVTLHMTSKDSNVDSGPRSTNNAISNEYLPSPLSVMKCLLKRHLAFEPGVHQTLACSLEYSLMILNLQ